MGKFVAREKLSKRARRELNSQRRVLWEAPPVTRVIESKKLYSRKKKQHLNRNDFSAASFLFAY